MQEVQKDNEVFSQLNFPIVVLSHSSEDPNYLLIMDSKGKTHILEGQMFNQLTNGQVVDTNFINTNWFCK